MGTVNATARSIVDRLPAEVAEQLGHYVYLYVDPRTQRPFYVGKGKGSRVLSHLSDPLQNEKTALIAELYSQGLEPQLEILAHGLADEESAFRVEAAVIDLLGLGNLTNQVAGWRSLQLGRISLEDLLVFYAAQPVSIEEPTLLFRLNRVYRRNMTALELYEATRGIWRLGGRREGARLAMAVFEGVVREVYSIDRWLPALSVPYETRTLTPEQADGRWEFVGRVAPEDIRTRYVNGSVKAYLTANSQNPCTYVDC